MDPSSLQTIVWMNGAMLLDPFLCMALLTAYVYKQARAPDKVDLDDIDLDDIDLAIPMEEEKLLLAQRWRT